MRVKVIQRAISLVTTLPPAFIHAVDLIVATTGAFSLAQDKTIYGLDALKILYTNYSLAEVYT